MMTNVRFRSALAALVLGVLACAITTTALAQQSRQPPERELTPEELIDNFAHYTIVARIDLARAYAQALLNLPISDADLIELIEDGPLSPERLETALSRALTIPELEDIAAELARRLEQGRLDLARSPARINQAVPMLTGTRRQQIIAQRRLQEAGEYAVPELLRQITNGNDARLRTASEQMLRTLGLPAVMPLAEAVRHIGDPAAQRIVCDVLGQIGYPHAGPFLMELRDDPKTASPVREAASRAIGRMTVRNSDLSAVYAALARDFFNDAQFLIPRPHEPTNNLWVYDQQIGLTPTAIPTEIFGRVMAMRFSTKALGLNPTNMPALSLFVAANLKRENDLPAGQVDPVFGEAPYTPMFYATAFGTGTCMDVLSMALDIQDTPLVRDAIKALARTTGGSNLFTFGGRQPLLEALLYPDRRVQYEAALTLARALPQQGFGGDYSVVPILASAVRTSDRLFAIVVGDDGEDRTELANRIEPLGFEIVGSGSDINAIRDAADHAVGIDFVIMRMNTLDRTYAIYEQIRRLPKITVAPVLIVVEQVEVPAVRLEFRGSPRVEVIRAGISDDAFANVVDSLLHRSSGVRITEAEAEAYAIQALAALRDIAISNSPVYDLRDAEIALLDALDSRSGGTRVLVANILALLDSSRAQQDLLDTALLAGEFEQIDLLAATTESVKRFGNRLRDHQITAVIDLVANSTGETAEAAAQLHGAMNLPTPAAIELILY